jgi:hypothetical protein
MRFTYAAPDRWVWLHHDGAPSGVITDGTTHVLIEDGVGVLSTMTGKVESSHKLMNLLNPMWMSWEDTELSDPIEGEAVGRSAWLISATPHAPGKVPVELAFDQRSGVLLYLKSPDSYLGFEELFLDEELHDETFRWDGPIDKRKVGTALVIPHEDGTYSVHWEISIKGRSMYHADGPAQVTRDAAVAWGEERAARTSIREQ